MRAAAFEELSKLVLRARELAEADRQPYWTRNAVIHVRQSHLIDLLQKHPTLGVVDDSGLSGGRVRVVDPDGGAPLLLKPSGSVGRPSRTVVAGCIQPQLPGLHSRSDRLEDAVSRAVGSQQQLGTESTDNPERLLAYELIGETDMAFHLGRCRRVEFLGGVEDRVEGDLKKVWDSRDHHSSDGFDQEEGEDWIDHLYAPAEQQEQAGG